VRRRVAPCVPPFTGTRDALQITCDGGNQNGTSGTHRHPPPAQAISTNPRLNENLGIIGSTYTANAFTALCRKLGIRQSMGRVGSCFDNAAAEAFFSSLEWEVLSRNRFSDTIQARAVVIDWCYTFYNQQRRHSAADGLSPVNYEIRESATKPEAA
jgi:transposase InsO family protein